MESAHPRKPKRSNRRRRAAAPTLSSKDANPQAAFLIRFGLKQDEYTQTGLTWTLLEQIRTRHTVMLQELQTTATYVSERLQVVPEVHSLKSRIKDGEHLMAKIIRKKVERPDFSVDIESYEAHITDLVGIRVLHLFKDDWKQIHNFIKETWDLFEEPTAYIRDGDSQQSLTDAGCCVKVHPLGYRSIHYVIKSNPAKCVRLVELQVRTIFEEGWAEIDHRVRYPRQSDDGQLGMFLDIFNLTCSR